jgi:hypothetical protein
VIPAALAAAVLLVSGSGCGRRESTPVAAAAPAATDPAPQDTESPTAMKCSLREADRPLLHPIHAGVNVRVDGDAIKGTYTRSRGKAFGVAYMLESIALADYATIELSIKTSPSQRPQLCLTDAAGVVWNAPALSSSTADQLQFDLTRLQPDPFQNGGRTLPPSADLSTMKMLTILDISGFMGGAEVVCEWTIDGLELLPRAQASAQSSGGGR